MMMLLRTRMTKFLLSAIILFVAVLVLGEGRAYSEETAKDNSFERFLNAETQQDHEMPMHTNDNPACSLDLRACLIAAVVTYDDLTTDPVQIGYAILNSECNDELLLCVGNDAHDVELVQEVKKIIAREQVPALVLKNRAMRLEKMTPH